MTLLWLGSLVGALLGIAHAAYVFRIVANSAPLNTPQNYLRAVYYAIWTFGLWVLFGTYILVLWGISVLFYLIFKAFR